MTTQSVSEQLSNDIANVVEKLGPSVARIDARGWKGASATVYSSDGVLVTAHHVIEREEQINVTLYDGRTLPGTLVGRDSGTDTAVVRIDATGLTPAPWSDLSGLRVGNLVVSVARPGKSTRAQLDIVSTLGEEFRTPSGGKLERYVSSNAVLQHGFSGGVLADLRGNALGMSTSGLMRGAGLIVPTKTLERVVKDILAHGQVQRGFLGVGVYPVRLTHALAQASEQKLGLVVVAVEPNSAAEKAGLLLGDVVLSIDGQKTENHADLTQQLEGKSGKEIVLKISRSGAITEVRATPGAR